MIVRLISAFQTDNDIDDSLLASAFQTDNGIDDSLLASAVSGYCANFRVGGVQQHFWVGSFVSSHQAVSNSIAAFTTSRTPRFR
jgi:hypothetical protein